MRIFPQYELPCIMIKSGNIRMACNPPPIHRKIKYPMPRRGNSPKNEIFEPFFCALKSELFQEFYEAAEAIEPYIYFNHHRIKIKGFIPVQYRTKSFGQSLFIIQPIFYIS